MSETNALIEMMSKEKKNANDCKNIYSFLSSIEFFKKYIDQNKKNLVFDMIERMKVEKVSSNSVVFMKGDKANKFYVVLKGEVQILVPDKKQPDKSRPSGISDYFKSDPRLYCYKNKRFLYQVVSVIKEGQCFGELGVLNNKPRLATVVTSMQTYFAVLSTDDFKEVLKPILMAELDSKIKLFKNVFENFCTYDEILKLSAYFQVVEFEKSKYLYKEGEKFTKIFLIIDGLVELKKNLWVKKLFGESTAFNTDDLGREQPGIRVNRSYRGLNRTVIVYGRNQLLGMKETMEQLDKYYHSAKVKETGMGYFITRENMLKCIADFPSVFIEKQKMKIRTIDVC